MTKVSVCIPTYNGERFVAAALESVLGQSYVDFELFVCDDCSMDGTLQVVSRFDDSRLRVIANQRRLGLVGNWNRCIRLACGEYTHVFHQDDVMLPTCVQRLAETLDDNPGVGFAFANVKTIDAEGRVIGGHWNPILPSEDIIFSPDQLLTLLLGNGNLVPCPAVMVRSRRFAEVGLFDERLHYTPDLEMWLRIALRHDVAYLSEPLVLQRRHDRQETSRFAGRVQEVDEVWLALQILFREQYHLISRPAELYDLALDHLLRWSYALCRSTARRGQIRVSLAYADRWAKFRWAKARRLRPARASLAST